MRVVKEAARFEYTRLSGPAGESDDGSDVIAGLSQAQKTLPCRYFYDDRGSALFERICELDEYYLTRTERHILERAAPEIARLTGPSELIELGSGSAQKTRLLLEAHARQSHPLRFLPIDVSEGMLKASARELLSLYEDLHIQGFSGTYEQAFAALGPRKSASRMLMFLGSTLGNFDAEARGIFLESATSAMAPGEYFLIGADLHKDKDILEAAYNDSQGITAAFNLNILRHLNRRFGANFVLDGFAHHAFYDVDRHWIEMHLRSLGDQTVALKDLGFEVTFEAEETIRTEISGKFDLAALAAEFAAKGWEEVAAWTDDRGWFAVTLFRLKDAPSGTRSRPRRGG
ncbi:MAG: L-histidine N(alpha)-methyltransferase [Alphaproteobacteria bacterium]